ncbi:interferon regulatory factor 9 isoform X2 [Aquarana catesbeiana]|uniref:interferon regulatory factor 9 isoform X2 n=1 Tax=Aquarana catesbeiana TaxID=8400 RepID=UPI003CC9F1AC
MATGRARSARKLKPWLVEQIESGKYHGLKWDDEQKKHFRIPWKHAGKQDFRHDEDAAIFKAWAQYKNKYQNGDKMDAAAWKTRLRCALNKSPEFQEVPQRSQLDIAEPYKVYRIVSPEEQENPPSGKLARNRKSSADSKAKSCDEVDHVDMKPKQELYHIETLEATSCASADSGNGSDTSNPDTPPINQHIPKRESCQPEIHNTTQKNPPSGKLARKRKSSADSKAKSWDEVDHVDMKAKQELSHIETLEATSCASADSGNGSDSNPDTHPINQHISKREPCQPELHNATQNFLEPLLPSPQCTYKDMQITLLYSGVEVSQSLIRSGECKLSARAPTQCLMEHVLFPLPAEPLDKETQKKTGDLLTFLEAGVMLASNKNGIFAQRQKFCKGRVYWTGPCTDSQGNINKLERNKHVKLFDTQKFLNELELYKTMGGNPPDYHVTLCFGEEFSDRDPTEDKLITAKIEQVMASESIQQVESLRASHSQDPDLEETSFPYLIQLMPVDTSDMIYP